jgi:thiamine-phosphate pyrophosphorylase
MALSINAHWKLNAAPRVRAGKRVPRLWFFTDDRLGVTNVDILQSLPRDTGVVLRTRQFPECLANWAQICRARGLLFLISGQVSAGYRFAAHGVHWPEIERPKRRASPLQLRTCSAHSFVALQKAYKSGADAIFVSPVFATVSHPGAHHLGRVRFGLMVRHQPSRVIALGGMTSQRAKGLNRFGIAAVQGWNDSAKVCRKP